MTRHQAIQMVITELEHACVQHPHWPKDPIHQAAVVAKESGELVQAVLQHVYEPHKGGAPVKEAVQTAAMAVRFLENNEICERCKPLGKHGLIELAVSRLARQVKEKGLNALDVTEDKFA